MSSAPKVEQLVKAGDLKRFPLSEDESTEKLKAGFPQAACYMYKYNKTKDDDWDAQKANTQSSREVQAADQLKVFFKKTPKDLAMNFLGQPKPKAGAASSSSAGGAEPKPKTAAVPEAMRPLMRARLARRSDGGGGCSDMVVSELSTMTTKL